MRAYPHKPDSESIARRLQGDVQDLERRRPLLPRAEAAHNPDAFRGASQLALRIGQGEYATEQTPEQVRKWLKSAAEYAQRAFELGVGLHPLMYQFYLALAVLMRQDGLRRGLQSLPRARFTDPDIRTDELVYVMSEAMAALAAGDRERAAELARAGLDRAPGSEPVARDLASPVLRIIASIATRDAAGLSAAIADREREHARAYTARSQRNSPDALIDIVGLGLLQLAKDEGLTLPPAGVYLPVELLS
jgi:hypothetical protein